MRLQITGRKIERLRRAVQFSVLLLCLYSGYRLYLFVGHFLYGWPAVQRPPMVDGFLPIGGMMGLKLWLTSGVFDGAHPAAIVVLAAAMLVSVLLKKSFCGWLCPVGTISETLWRAGERLFGRNFRMHRYVDYPLRAVKYALLAFFLLMIFVMSPGVLARFLGGPDWAVSDAKMLWFFEYMSATAGVVIAGLFAGSLFYRNFWCRYFCPYGALLGLLSFLSPVKITRRDSACAHCGACRKACPAGLPIDENIRTGSPECIGCLSCVARCPEPGALGMGLMKMPASFFSSGDGGSLPPESRRAVAPLLFAVLVLAVFFGVIAAAKASGHWVSVVPDAVYQKFIPFARGFYR